MIADLFRREPSDEPSALFLFLFLSFHLLFFSVIIILCLNIII